MCGHSTAGKAHFHLYTNLFLLLLLKLVSLSPHMRLGGRVSAVSPGRALPTEALTASGLTLLFVMHLICNVSVNLP